MEIINNEKLGKCVNFTELAREMNVKDSYYSILANKVCKSNENCEQIPTERNGRRGRLRQDYLVSVDYAKSLVRNVKSANLELIHKLDL